MEVPAAAEAPARAPAETLRELMRHHGPYVGRCLRYLGVRDSDLDDALQEVFLVVHRRAGELRPDSSFRAWLYAIARNVARASRRQVATRREVFGEPLPQGEVSGDQERVDTRNRVLTLLADLEDDKREAFVLYHVEQLSVRELADILGCPHQTVHARLQSATRDLERAVRREEAKQHDRT